jgi:hypothetical protein
MRASYQLLLVRRGHQTVTLVYVGKVRNGLHLRRESPAIVASSLKTVVKTVVRLATDASQTHQGGSK